jgi:hypothetical protein
MKLLTWLLGMVALASMAGCVRESSTTGTTEIRSPSMTDPEPLTGNNVESPLYHWADAP